MFDWITSFILRTGYFGIAALMLAENVFPPIPSELVMPLAGYQIASGNLALLPVLVSGSIGSLAGAYFWYWLARRLGPERTRRLVRRHGRWLTMTPSDLTGASAWFRRNGGMAVLLGRMIPTVRSLISIPAGLTGMPAGRFLLLSAVGVTGWNIVLVVAGLLLKQAYPSVATIVDPVSTASVVGLLGWYVVRVITFRRSPDGPADVE